MCSVMKCKCVEETPTLKTELAARHWSRRELVSVSGISQKFYVIGCGFVCEYPFYTIAIPLGDKNGRK